MINKEVLIFFVFNDISNIAIEHITDIIQSIESDTPIVFEIIKHTSTHFVIFYEIVLRNTLVI